MGIYCKIFSGKVSFPSFMSSSAKSLTSSLLRADFAKRLGGQGSSQVAAHEFFALNWQDLLHRKVPENCEALRPDELDFPAESDFPTPKEVPRAVSGAADPFRADGGPFISEDIAA